MTVKELKELLKDLDEDLSVFVRANQHLFNADVVEVLMRDDDLLEEDDPEPWVVIGNN